MNTPPTSKPVALPGDLVDQKFKIERVIGEGGMGLVMLAVHEELGERVALKFLRQETLANSEIVARFKNEARAAVRLKSNHIARVMDVGSHRGVPFMVMEYLEGGDLASVILHGGRVSVADACELVIQACEGLAEAHARGIVHRDIKPENLFITQRHGFKVLKILDFGISKAALSDGNNLVQTTQIMGSPYYMSPEQLRSTKNVDLRADIWSLGAVLFELLSGERAFEATDSLAVLISAITLERPRRLDRLRPDLPLELVEIVMRCLERDPATRFQNTGELAVALAPFAPRRAHPVIESTIAILRASQLPGVETLQVPQDAEWSGRPSSATDGLGGARAQRSLQTEPTAAAIATGPVAVADPGQPSSSSERGGAQERSQSAVHTASAVTHAASVATGKSNLVFYGVVGAVALGLAVTAFVIIKPTSSSKTAGASPVTAAPETIEVTLRAEPRDTKFTIDNGPPLENPYVGKRPRDNAPHVIRAKAPGHKEKTREVTFAADVTLGLQLSKEKLP